VLSSNRTTPLKTFLIEDQDTSPLSIYLPPHCGNRWLPRLEILSPDVLFVAPFPYFDKGKAFAVLLRALSPSLLFARMSINSSMAPPFYFLLKSLLCRLNNTCFSDSSPFPSIWIWGFGWELRGRPRFSAPRVPTNLGRLLFPLDLKYDCAAATVRSLSSLPRTTFRGSFRSGFLAAEPLFPSASTRFPSNPHTFSPLHEAPPRRGPRPRATGISFPLTSDFETSLSSKVLFFAWTARSSLSSPTPASSSDLTPRRRYTPTSSFAGSPPPSATHFWLQHPSRRGGDWS